MRYAAIDLGTNTFHIIIVEIIDKKIEFIHRERFVVKLVSENSTTIEEKAQKRSLKAVRAFKEAINKYNVKRYKAYGTCMFRRADNGIKFAEKLEAISDINIEIIDTKKEAYLIYKGAKTSGAISKGRCLVMDIGGGSVEFIITNQGKIISTFSFQVGILKLINKFKYLEPFNSQTIDLIIQYLAEQTSILVKELKKHKIDYLVGTAGSFEVLQSVTQSDTNDDFFEVSETEFNKFFEKVYDTTLEERKALKIIPQNRVELIVYAFILIKFAINITKPKSIKVTPFSIKEGIISELIKEQ